MEDLVQEVIEQIKKDLAEGDIQALEEMLLDTPREVLEAYLPE